MKGRANGSNLNRQIHLRFRLFFEIIRLFASSFDPPRLDVIERIRRVAQDRLDIDFLFEDPKAYTKPWKGKKIFFLKPNWEIMEYMTCEDRWTDEMAGAKDGKTGR